MWQIQFHVCVQKLHSHNSERIIKTDPHLTKLCKKQKGLQFFFDSQCTLYYISGVAFLNKRRAFLILHQNSKTSNRCTSNNAHLIFSLFPWLWLQKYWYIINTSSRSSGLFGAISATAERHTTYHTVTCLVLLFNQCRVSSIDWEFKFYEF